MNQPDEFYIGWETKAAPGIGKTVRKAVVVLLTLALLAPITLAVSQRMIGASVFEWGNHKRFSGILQTTPYPHLLVPRPGSADGLPRYSTYYLVAPWKFGLDHEAIAPLDGKSVMLKGTLIYRGNQTMIETKSEWIQANEKSSAPVAEPRPAHAASRVCDSLHQRRRTARFAGETKARSSGISVARFRRGQTREQASARHGRRAARNHRRS